MTDRPVADREPLSAVTFDAETHPLTHQCPWCKKVHRYDKDTATLDAVRAHPDEARLRALDHEYELGREAGIREGILRERNAAAAALAQPAVPVTGAEDEPSVEERVQESYRRGWLEATSRSSEPPAQPGDDGLARSGVDDVGELRRIERRLSDIYRVVAHNASNEAVLTREAVALGMEAAAVHHPGREE